MTIDFNFGVGTHHEWLPLKQIQGHVDDHVLLPPDYPPFAQFDPDVEGLQAILLRCHFGTQRQGFAVDAYWSDLQRTHDVVGGDHQGTGRYCGSN